MADLNAIRNDTHADNRLPYLGAGCGVRGNYTSTLTGHFPGTLTESYRAFSLMHEVRLRSFPAYWLFE